jgi:glycosyltransferase involved in cell wall biosynthesis
MVPARFRPRSTAERIAVAAALLAGSSPPPVEDGFGAACADLFRPPSRAGAPAGPLVTVLICTYNRAGWLGEAIDSALAQTWPVEVVVVDDGSDDDTPAVLAKYGERIRVFRHPANAGKPAALNTGLAQLRGEAYLVLDDDDCLVPGAIAALAGALFMDEQRVAACGDTIVFDGESGAALDWRPATRLPPERWRHAVLVTVPAMPGATLVRTSAQRRLDPYDPRLVRGQDMDHFLRLSALGAAVCVPLPVQLYRRHDALRGSAAARWQKHRDPVEHRRRFLASVKPVFGERWERHRGDRAEGYAWALGLLERELREEARAELARWPHPFDAWERWVRARAGLASPPPAIDTVPTLVIDDGDEGALAQLLSRMGPTERLSVVAPRAHDGLASCQLFWPGEYRVERPLAARSGSIRVRLSSAPDWQPPPVPAGELLALPPADSAITLCVALGASPPETERAPAGLVRHPLTIACVTSACGPSGQALEAAAMVLEHAPAWVPGRQLAARACARAGLRAEAEALLRPPG